jgi:SAM-dependent methyltransferase
MIKYTVDQILNLYREESLKHGESGTSTIQDARTRELEIASIFSYLADGLRVLEVGCGNGYVAAALVSRFAVELDAFDFSPELIEIAKQRTISSPRGVVKFRQGDVLELNSVASYDVVFTERVLQNLVTWDDQVRAIGNIAKALKAGGRFIMEECFWSGLNNLNAARNELGLDPIPESWHNLFFHDDAVKEACREVGLTFVEENRFLSGYYFGSRVLLPALVPQGKRVSSASVLNDYFCALPPAGDFSPMKIMVFHKSTN